jgi:chromosome segregation ATPase
MADTTNELMYEILKQLQADMAGVKDALRENNAALNAIRIHMVGLQQDTQNIYATLTRHDARLDRIERRLEIAEVG